MRARKLGFSVFGQATIISWFLFYSLNEDNFIFNKKDVLFRLCTTIRPKLMSFVMKVQVRSATIKMRVGRSCGGLKYSLTISFFIIDVVPMQIILKIFKHILIVRMRVSFDVIRREIQYYIFKFHFSIFIKKNYLIVV